MLPIRLSHVMDHVPVLWVSSHHPPLISHGKSRFMPSFFTPCLFHHEGTAVVALAYMVLHLALHLEYFHLGFLAAKTPLPFIFFNGTRGRTR